MVERIELGWGAPQDGEHELEAFGERHGADTAMVEPLSS
jgi:hypothetical protein